MRSYNRPASALLGVMLAGITLTACGGGGDRQASDVAAPGATSTQSPDADSRVDQAGSSDTRSSAQCAAIGDNLSYDELLGTPSSTVTSQDPETLRGLIESTPAGGHQNFLSDYCAITIETYGADDPISIGVVESMDLAPTRVGALVAAYETCLSVQEFRSPSETFEPDEPRETTNKIFKIANKYLCPQIAFPQFPS